MASKSSDSLGKSAELNRNGGEQMEKEEMLKALERELEEEDIVVDHPPHYETGRFECIEVMEEALGREEVKDFCLCNAFKYLYRCTRKNGLEDLKKARWYLNRRIEMEEEDEEE